MVWIFVGAPQPAYGKPGPAGIRFVILDEVTYIRGWDKGVKYLADSGALEDVVLVLSGSDMIIIREARMCFPGRRGMANQVDFQVFPLEKDVVPCGCPGELRQWNGQCNPDVY